MTKDLDVNEKDNVQVIIDYLNNNSPQDFDWVYSNYFFNVTVPYVVLDEYLVFVESLVKCKYTFRQNSDDTITLLFSL